MFAGGNKEGAVDPHSFFSFWDHPYCYLPVALSAGGNKKEGVDPRYLISFCDKLCCYMPESIRKMFRCADDYTTVQVSGRVVV